MVAESCPVWCHTPFWGKKESKKPSLTKNRKLKGTGTDGHPFLIHCLRMQAKQEYSRDAVLILT